MHAPSFFQCTVVGMLAILLVRQEIIRMSTKATLTDVTDGLTTLEGDVSTIQATTTKLAGDSSTILLELQTLQGQSTNPPDFDAIVARQTALHNNLVALNTSLSTIDEGDVAGEPVVDVPPTS
jgi:hypothetical protein